MSSKDKTKLALVIHNHQPVGNKDQIIERIYKTAYSPFLKALSRYPEVQVNLHYTGFLLDWLQERHPDFVDSLRILVNRKQVELVGGAYYEPVISVIPEEDALGQTRLLSEKIKSMFGVEPSGFWMAERAWEPQVPEFLAKAGARHTFIDDVSFESVGLSESDCFQPYLVESRGSFAIVFPILKKLRYLIPFKSVSSTLAYLKQSRSKGIVVYGDDGEKFGAWPTTFEQVYGEGWLESFFEAITRQSWIETVKISDFLKENPPRQRVYLPASAYSEMMEWSIPLFLKSAREKNRSVRNKRKDSVPLRGFWRLFLARYPESARMYSKMLRLSELVNSLEKTKQDGPLIDLWKGQCNDAYWHGIFGGLYAPILRAITYHNLIKAQAGFETRAFASGEDWLSVTEDKYLGHLEYHMDSHSLGIVVSPILGGAVCEIDFKPRFANILDTLARRPERYHAEVRRKVDQTIVPSGKRIKSVSIHESPKSRERGLQKLLVYDKYEKFSFIDHLVHPDTTLESFVRQDFREIIPLPACAYEVEIQKSNDTAAIALSLGVNSRGRDGIRMKKTMSIPVRGASLSVDYTVQTSRSLPGSAIFLPEINFGSLSDRSIARNFGKEKIVKTAGLEIPYEENGFTLSLSCGNATSIWIAPVRTVSLSEEGYESNLQGISVLPYWTINADSWMEPFHASIHLEIRCD